MRELNIAICDDEEFFLKKMIYYVRNAMDELGRAYKLYKCHSGVALVKTCMENPMDIIVSDIEMENLSGFDAVEKIKEYYEDIIVIFVTMHDKYDYQSYDYEPYQLVKKYEIHKLEKVTMRCIRKFFRQGNVIRINTESGAADIDCDDIIYFENSKHYIKGVCSSGKILTIRGNFQMLEEQLPKAQFFTAQRGYIVNNLFVQRLGTQTVLLKNQEEITLTRNKEQREKIKMKYIRFTRENVR